MAFGGDSWYQCLSFRTEGQKMGNMNKLRWLLAGLLCQLVSPTWGQQQATVDLMAVVQAAKDRFRVAPPAQAQAAGAKLVQDMTNLDRYLGAGANGQAWRQFLLWEQLQSQVAPDAMVDATVLENVRYRFESQRPGLELPRFVAVRNSLVAYERAILSAQEDGAQQAAEQLEALAAALAVMDQNPLAPYSEDAAAALRWLSLRGQAPEVVQAVRRVYARPNFFFHVSERFLAIGIERKVNRREPITEVILGTHIRGMGDTSGYVDVQLVPSAHRAMIDSLFNGVTYSRTVGRNGPATIHSAGRTVFQVRKRIYLDPDGIKTVPATAAARTHTNTLSVNAGRGGWLLGGIANRIAANRVAQNKPRSEAISAERAEDRLIRRVERDANPDLGDANRDFQNNIRYPLLEQGQYPADLKLRTNNDYLYGRGTEANRWQLGAAEVPAALQAPSDVGLYLHQTALNNLADGTLSGDRVTQEDFEKRMTDLLGRVPENFQREEDRPSWVITFAEQQPVRVTIGDNTLKIALSVRALEGTAETRRHWILTAVYRLESIPGGLRGVREGELDVSPPGNEPLSGTAAGEKANIKRQFERDLFKPEYVHDGLEPTGDWAKAGKLPLVEYVCREGWLNLGWLMAAPARTAARGSAAQD
jgi:hypothetical protein